MRRVGKKTGPGEWKREEYEAKSHLFITIQESVIQGKEADVLGFENSVIFSEILKEEIA